MRNYASLLEQKAALLDVETMQQDIESAENWDDAYWIGRFVYEQASGEADKLIMDAYEKAFELGLNIRVNRECFLAATQQIARIYFQFRKYEDTINKLMVLDANADNLPDWVSLYFASAQIHTENILHWAENPKFLFKRIDGIDESNPESVKRRKYLFLEFLNRISELSRTKDVSGVDKEAILDKAVALGISNSGECLNFKRAFGVSLPLPEEPEEPEELEDWADPEPEDDTVSAYEQKVSELSKQASELQAIIDTQTQDIAQYKKQIDDQQKRIASLQGEKKALKSKAASLSEELKIAKENEYAAQEKCKALESQLSGSEVARKQLEEDASVIGKLRSDVDDLKAELTESRGNNEGFLAEIDAKQKTIEELQAELLRSQEKIRKLHADIESQRAQIVVPTAAGETPSVLSDNFEVDNFLLRGQKILIIGGSEAKERHLRGMLKKMGFDFDKDQLEFVLEYDDVKNYVSRIKPWGGKYAGIIVGPCPHKARDTDGYSSFIEKIKSEEGYPHVEEARDSAGSLKISNTSIGNAMKRMAVHLLSICYK